MNDYITQKPFTNEEIKRIDTQLGEYEQIFLNPDIERNLISRNELLASFAISKAENSSLTLKEAQDVYDVILSNEEYTFISDKYLPDFTVYKAGNFRDNDLIRVGTYTPAPHKEIEKGVEELLTWLKEHKTITDVALFHTALYALHPFNNGNKRVCRVLEHPFFRNLGINQKNLYSTSYYYHKQKERYYKYLLYSLERKNLNHRSEEHT